MDMQTLMTIICSVFASTGFWAFVTYLIQRHDRKDNLELKMLKGLAHDRICYLGETYAARGWLTRDEYENLHDYLFLPYKALGGNGTAEKLMHQVDALPIRNKE